MSTIKTTFLVFWIFFMNSLAAQDITVVQSNDELLQRIEVLRSRSVGWRNYLNPINERSKPEIHQYGVDVKNYIFNWENQLNQHDIPYVDLMKGVKIFHFILDDEIYSKYLSNSLPPIEQAFYDGLKEFMDLYFPSWKFVSTKNVFDDNIPKSFCDIGFIRLSIEDSRYEFHSFFDSSELIQDGNIQIEQLHILIDLFPDSYNFHLKSIRNIKIPKNHSPNNLKTLFRECFIETFGFVKIPYDKSFRRTLESNFYNENDVWTEWKVLNHIENKRPNELEGIYSRVVEMQPYKYLFKPERIGIVKESDRYNFIYLGGGALNTDDWVEGEIVAWFYDFEHTSKKLHWSNIFKIWDKSSKIIPNYNPIIKQFTDTSGNFYFEIHTSKGELILRYKKVIF